jgi:hypothetical protein
MWADLLPAVPVDLGRATLGLEHVRQAVKTAIGKAQQTVTDAYQAATMSSHKDNLFTDVLLACVLADLGSLTHQRALQRFRRVNSVGMDGRQQHAHRQPA